MNFQDPAEVQALARETNLVQLSFPRSADKANLYATQGMLKAWSKVLANCLEDAQMNQNAASGSSKGGASPSDIVTSSIPLDDEDCTAWVDALKLMYPSRPLFEVTWENAERLLLLADKYDMPGITGNEKFLFTCPLMCISAISKLSSCCSIETLPGKTIDTRGGHIFCCCGD